MENFNEFMKDGWSYPKKHTEGSADPEVIEQSVNKYFEKNPPTNYITPQMFGAVADGTTDDSEAIQKAIDEAQNGATLFFPKGVYAITKGLTTSNKYLNIKGERIGRHIGKNDVLTEKIGSIIKYIGTSDATLITQGSSDWNLTISDIILYSDSCKFTDNGLDDSTIPYSQYSIEKKDIVVNGIKTINTSSMRGVAIVGMSGYGLSPAQAMNIIDCKFHSCNICIQAENNDIMLRNCYLTSSATAIYCVTNKNIIISDCYIDLLSEYGIYCENYLSGSITDTYIDHTNYAAVCAKGAFNNLNLDVYCGRNAVYYAGSELTDLKNTQAVTELENMAFGAAICANLVFKSQIKIHAIERPVDDAGKSSKNAPTIGLYIQQLRSGIIEGVQLKSYIRNTSNTTEPVSINANGIISSVYKNREYKKVGMYIATYEPKSTHIASQVGDLWLCGNKMYIAVEKTDTSTTWAPANEVDKSQIQSIINSYVEENISSLKGEKGDPGQDGAPGADGITPHIGENGNWFIGDRDTGQPAGGSGGNDTKNVVSKLTEMNVAVFGDSISDPKVNGMWVKPFKELVTCKSFTNYARGYCTWTFKSDSEYNITDVSNSNVGNNVIWNQFNRLKNDVDNGNVANPDLIIIFAGTNDALQAKTIGDADTTFVSSTQGDITTLTNLIDSIRYVCDAIYSKYPDSNIVLCTPLPLAQGGYAQCIKVRDAIVKCAERMGLYYIDATYESGIAWYREKLSPTYYTSGGVHMSNEGGDHIAKFLYGALTNLVGYVTGASGGNTGGDEPSLDTVDKTALNTAITTANNDLSSALISEDGTDIPTTLQWVTQSVYDDFNSAIATATTEYISEESTQATVETARTDLIFAKETFDNAKAYGTKTRGDDPVTDTGIVTIDGVDYDISVASDYPYKMIVNVSGNKRLYTSNNRFYIQSTSNTECMTADSYYTSFTNNKANALTKIQTSNAIDDAFDPPYYKIGSNRSIENYLWVNHDLYYYGTENVAVNKHI